MRSVSVIRRLALCAAVMLLLGIAAGFAWIQFAHPAQWEVLDKNVVLTEAASTGQFSVVVVFMLIGAIVSVVGAWGMTWALGDLGWLVTPVVVVLTVIAGVIAWRIGVDFGPPDPTTVTPGAVGDTIPAQLKIDWLAPFLVWPIFGLVGVVAATSASPTPAEGSLPIR